MNPSARLHRSPKTTRPVIHVPAHQCPKTTCLLGSGVGTPRALGDTSLEAVLELSGDGAEVSHAAGAGDLSALSLLGPVVLAGLSSGVAARSAGVLLVVHGTATAASADPVGLVVALAKAGGTLRCCRESA